MHLMTANNFIQHLFICNLIGLFAWFECMLLILASSVQNVLLVLSFCGEKGKEVIIKN